jgi:integrase
MANVQISVRGFAEVSAAAPERKQTTLNRYRAPNSAESVGRSNYYVKALSLIKRHHRGDSAFVASAIQSLFDEGMAESDPRKRTKLLSNHRASPLKIGRLPYSYTGFWRELDRACKVCGLGHIGTHTFRHSYRTWIDAIGTPVGVQQKLMRHSDIRTTMNIYGDAESGEMQKANGKIVEMAFSLQ